MKNYLIILLFLFISTYANAQDKKHFKKIEKSREKRHIEISLDTVFYIGEPVYLLKQGGSQLFTEQLFSLQNKLIIKKIERYMYTLGVNTYIIHFAESDKTLSYTTSDLRALLFKLINDKVLDNGKLNKEILVKINKEQGGNSLLSQEVYDPLGKNGKNGTSGSSGNATYMAGKGQNGQNGQNGDNYEVYIKALGTASNLQAQVLIKNISTGEQTKKIIAKDSTNIVIDAYGGNGGRGGQGGGGNSSTKGGTDGADGGHGGDGGNGGRVTLIVDTNAKEFIEKIEVKNKGGKAGGYGHGGSGGSGGGPYGGPDGRNGNNGVSGRPGIDGPTPLITYQALDKLW